MTKKCIVLFLFYLVIKMGVDSFQGHVDFDISRRNNIHRFPWMVTIVDINDGSFFSYGTLIHERAVLTLSNIEIKNAPYFSVQVFAECYFPDHVFTSRCSQVKNISEHVILQRSDYDIDGNLAIVILSEAFKLSETVNVIHFARHDTDFDPDKCSIIALKNLTSTYGYQLKAKMMTSTHIKIFSNLENPIQYKLYFGSNSTTSYDDEGRAEIFDDVRYAMSIDYFGGPMVCKSTRRNDHWLLVGVVHDVLIIYQPNPSFHFEKEVLRVDMSDLQKLFSEMIRSSFPSENIDCPVLKIG